MTGALRTLHVRVGAPFGGVERFIEHLFRRTDPETYRATLILLARTVESGKRVELGERVRALGRPVEVVPMPRRTAIRSARAAVRDLIEAHSPQVVHTYGLRSNLIAGPVAKRLGIPWVVRQPNVNRFDYDNPLAGWAAYLLNNALLRRADAVHVISEALLSHVRGLWWPPRNPVLIPNGVDTERFHPSNDRAEARAALGKITKSLGEDVPIAVSIGRLLHLKGYDLLLEAWRDVRREVPGALLFVLGDGPLKGELEARAENLGLGDAVHFPGFTGDVLPYLQAATLYVQSSRTEGVSQTVLEAMAVGLPVVATDVGGTGMVVEDRRTGRLIPPGSAAELTEAILDVAGTRQAVEWGEAGLRAAREKWSVDRMIQSVSELDRTLIAGRNDEKN